MTALSGGVQSCCGLNAAGRKPGETEIAGARNLGLRSFLRESPVPPPVAAPAPNRGDVRGICSLNLCGERDARRIYKTKYAWVR